MKTSSTLKMTLKNLSVHAFRSFLAATGVVLGIAAVLSMTAISEGAKRKALDQIKAMGLNNILVQSVRPAATSTKTPQSDKSYVAAYGLNAEDARHIQNTFENVRLVVPVRNLLSPARYGERKTECNVMATTPDFIGLAGARLADSRGRFLTWLDERNLNTVCLIGRKASRALFGFGDPMGQTIKCGKISFKVVGILDNPAGIRMAGLYDLNDIAIVPSATADAMFGDVLLKGGARSRREMVKVAIDYLYVSVSDTADIGNTSARVRAYLARTHGDGDYQVQVPHELLVQEENTQRIFAFVMGSIAAISLLVGGIGIMNIMLANIFERMQEIGTRRALGAKKSDILIQFLAESVVLTVVGGGAGLVLGAAIAAAVRHYADIPAVITLPAVLASLAVAALTGIAFGTYPAWKAANLDPIATLRR